MDKHIDSLELEALVSWSEGGDERHKLSPATVDNAERHVASCTACQEKVSEYRRLVSRLSLVAGSEATSPRADCPKPEDVDWHEVIAGVWPELRARQLILHAALCEYCGPLLRAAACVDENPTAQERELLAQLKAPSRPKAQINPKTIARSTKVEPAWRRFLAWRVVVPAATLILLAGVLGNLRPSVPPAVSGQTFAEFAVQTHRQYAQGSLALDVREASEQGLNEWFKTKSPFSLALPAAATPSGDLPYQPVGARLLQLSRNSAVLVAYQVDKRPVSLMVAPTSAAVASGGVEIDFQKVSFHYRMVENYRVVTWSVHDLTYALVSQEGNGTQRSCMVCHSAMRDRDLSQTPAPLPADPGLQ